MPRRRGRRRSGSCRRSARSSPTSSRRRGTWPPTSAPRYSAGDLELTRCPDACEGGWVRVDTSDIDLDLYGHAGVTTAVAPCSACQPLLAAIRAHRATRGHPENPKDCHDCRLLREDPAADIGWLHEARIAQGRVRMRRDVGEPASPDRVKHLIADAREALADGIARRQEREAERSRSRFAARTLPGTSADDVQPLVTAWSVPDREASA